MAKKYTKHSVKFRTPHITPKGVNEDWGFYPVKVLVRWGAGSKAINSPKPLRCPVELNPLPAIIENADKLKMKKIFAEKGISSPEFMENTKEARELFKKNKWNVVYKRKFHSGGKGMEFEPVENIDKFADAKYKGGILERRINTKREFRIHVICETGKYFAVEKLRRKDKLDEKARNLENCVFKAQFNKPDDWRVAVGLSFNAAKAMGLDFSAVDIAWSGKNWYVIETNSAAGLGANTKEFYNKELKKVIEIKVKKYLENK